MENKVNVTGAIIKGTRIKVEGAKKKIIEEVIKAKKMKSESRGSKRDGSEESDQSGKKSKM